MSNMNDRIRIAFEKENISYRELESKTGISRMTLQRYVTGATQKISIDAIEKIAIALHTTPAYIMGWETEDKKYSENELDEEILKIFDRLSEEKQKQILDYMAFLAAQE